MLWCLFQIHRDLSVTFWHENMPKMAKQVTVLFFWAHVMQLIFLWAESLIKLYYLQLLLFTICSSLGLICFPKINIYIYASAFVQTLITLLSLYLRWSCIWYWCSSQFITLIIFHCIFRWLKIWCIILLCFKLK